MDRTTMLWSLVKGDRLCSKCKNDLKRHYMQTAIGVYVYILADAPYSMAWDWVAYKLETLLRLNVTWGEGYKIAFIKAIDLITDIENTFSIEDEIFIYQTIYPMIYNFAKDLVCVADIDTKSHITDWINNDLYFIEVDLLSSVV